MTTPFNYDDAFSRNIGWVTRDEQASLRKKCVAIAGMGGVGGVHLLTLVRLGIGTFTIADFDTFDVANFNRQVGASMSTVGSPKADVLAQMARDINPEVDIRIFRDGVTRENLQDFFQGADLYVDGLDFFAFEARRDTFATCARLKIPAVTAAPLGFGTAVLTFIPGKMTFEEYFQWGNLPENEMAIRFLLGLAPRGLHYPYLADMTAVSLEERRGPSSIIGCQLCAGIAAGEALKILLKRGKVVCAPHGIQFDAYRNKLVHTWRPGGNRHILQRIAFKVAAGRLSRQKTPADPLKPT